MLTRTVNIEQAGRGVDTAFLDNISIPNFKIAMDRIIPTPVKVVIRSFWVVLNSKVE